MNFVLDELTEADPIEGEGAVHTTCCRAAVHTTCCRSESYAVHTTCCRSESYAELD